ncbi:MAG: hypothetical protein ACTHK7_06305 [Aureliella sp.]
MRCRIIMLVLCAAALATGPGCSSLTKSKGSKKDSPWESMKFWKKEYQQPAKMAVLWSHDILTVEGKPPTRGFGGRIYFYNNKSQAIPVEGELVVHAFDETTRRFTGAPENQPDKRFRFTAEQFTQHFSESDLGASYSVWIPWDAADGMQKEITLVPTFRSSKGELVQGTPAKVVLPGRTISPSGGLTTTPIQRVSYQESTFPTVNGPLPQVGPVATEKKNAGMRTTTITLPKALGQRSGAGSQGGSASAPMQPGAAANPASAAIEQARAQLIADTFKPAQPVAQRPLQSFSAWTPNTVPTAGSLAVNVNNIVPPGWPNQAQSAAQAHGPGQATHPGQARPAPEPTPEELGLPPGVQLSPRATAW